VDKKSTKIIFTNGQDIIVDVSVKTIEYRIQRAFLLKYRLERRTKHLLVQYDRVKVFQRFALDMLEDET